MARMFQRNTVHKTHISITNQQNELNGIEKGRKATQKVHM